MRDSHDRIIEYLRISVTDRCNLRCRYCMPEAGVKLVPHDEILSFDEIVRVASVMTNLGIRRIRLTGGEPLVRRGIERLAASLRQLEGPDFLGLTTNGVLLKQKAAALFEAGVDGVNISLDTTDRARYAFLTCRDELSAAMEGLHTALDLPFRSVKLNCVLSPQSLKNDWLGVVALAKELPVDVRLIEWMPISGGGVEPVRMDSAIRLITQKFGDMTPLEKMPGGPARYFSVGGFRGKIGFIPSMTHNFCSGCNRVRLTSTGDLKTCLFYDTGMPMRPLLRGGAGDSELEHAILAAVSQKPEKHGGAVRQSDDSAKQLIDRPCGMSGIGG